MKTRYHFYFYFYKYNYNYELNQEIRTEERKQTKWPKGLVYYQIEKAHERRMCSATCYPSLLSPVLTHDLSFAGEDSVQLRNFKVLNQNPLSQFSFLFYLLILIFFLDLRILLLSLPCMFFFFFFSSGYPFFSKIYSFWDSERASDTLCVEK